MIWAKARRWGAGISLMLWSLSPAWALGPAPGDLVFRQGTEPVSELVRALDSGGYSHVGMLVGEAPDWQVLHAIPEGGVVREPLADFIAADKASRHAIYRVAAEAGQRRRATAFAEARLGEPFAITAAGPQGGTYCTRLIDVAWQAAGLDLQARYTSIDMPLAKGRFLLPSGLAASPLVSPLSPPVPGQ